MNVGDFKKMIRFCIFAHLVLFVFCLYHSNAFHTTYKFSELNTFSRYKRSCRCWATEKNHEPYEIPRIERIFAISDLHTDDNGNLQWLREKCNPDREQNDSVPGPNDALIIAGDISHEMDRLRETLSIIKEGLECEVFFVSGNHEAWTVNEPSGLSDCSLTKLDKVNELCRSLGVITDQRLVGSSNMFPVWILPMDSWYDGTLAFDDCEEFCEDFGNWP